MARPHLILGLDIGSSTIKGLVAGFNLKKKENYVETLGFIEEPSFGIRKGVVINPTQVTDILIRLLDRLEEQVGHTLTSAYVNVNGVHIFSAQSKGLVSVSRADQKISQEDIERVLEAAQTLSLPFNKEILEVLPKDFIVDGERGIRDPQGLKGVRLEVEALLLGGFSPYIKNLTTAVLNSGVKINDLIFSPLASARAVLTPKEKELGVVLIDIGAGNTGIAVFEESRLLHLTILPVGSANITNDIAIYLKSDIEIAERIKREYGAVEFKGQDKREKIKLPDGEMVMFSRKQIVRVVEERVSEIFIEINKELKKIGKQELLPAGVVLTGGGAKLPRIKELAKKVLKLPCRIGKPKEINLPADDIRLVGVCGLVLSGIDAAREESSLESSFSLSGITIREKIKKIFKIFIP